MTSLYTPDRAYLAETMQEAIELGEPIEGAFSRNRSFSKKFRRYGHYVPRGQVGEQKILQEEVHSESPTSPKADTVPNVGLSPQDMAWGDYGSSDAGKHDERWL